MVCDPRHHEQQIGQSIQVDQNVLLDLLATEADDTALGTTADGARDVQRRTRCGPTGQNETPQRGKLSLELVDPSFEAFGIVFGDSRLLDALGDRATRICEAGTDREKVALQPLEHGGQRWIDRTGANEAQPGIELVDVAVGGHTRIGFRDTRPAEQRRIAAVASPGVDFHSPIIGVFERRALAPARGGSARVRSTRRIQRDERIARRPPRQIPVPADRQRFRRRLLEWYRRYGRDLPWRQTTDPYHILVSEVMLQQTQVDRVLPKYAEWLEKYPTLEALAAAAEADVSATWRPLGYNVRPKRLHAIARESMARYGGQLPSDEETLLSFKGIGE
jgi:hypothetical protein